MNSGANLWPETRPLQTLQNRVLAAEGFDRRLLARNVLSVSADYVRPLTCPAQAAQNWKYILDNIYAIIQRSVWVASRATPAFSPTTGSAQAHTSGKGLLVARRIVCVDMSVASGSELEIYPG